MHTRTVLPSVPGAVKPRSVLLISPDGDLRQRVAEQLLSIRWTAMLARGGAEAWAHLDQTRPEAILLDRWLPDLDADELSQELVSMFPDVDILAFDGTPLSSSGRRGARRHELMHVLREAEPATSPDGAAWNSAPVAVPAAVEIVMAHVKRHTIGVATTMAGENRTEPQVKQHLPELVGNAAAMRELAEEVRLAAPFQVSVLIEGETGTGKEVVAKALHRLSDRSSKPFAVLNCAAIPEHLLEAELFGHTRGAFTGAVNSRVGRIEAAHGGTLFLDEIGEMPLALQAKLLRFLECGELQKIGDNETVRVDVRIVAATHQPLEQRSEEGSFRLDLYHRLAVFPIHIPALRERMEDLPMLVAHLLRRLGEKMPARTISDAALQVLAEHHWPGNVRELGHVLERAAILTGERPVLLPQDIRIRRRPRAS